MDPRTPAAQELNRLLDRRRELVNTAQDADARARFSNTDVLDAQEAVANAERARLSGAGSDKAVETAEKKLDQARRLADVPWTQRAIGARSAIRDAEKKIGAYVGEHFTELVADYNARAEEAKDAVDSALRAV